MMSYRKPIIIRDDTEGHRQATWVELFIDLAFVVGISRLGQIFEEGFTLSALWDYGLLFFMFFWIWNRFTWYASYYDNDDVPYRLTYLILIFPVLGIASQIGNILQGDFFKASLYYIFINLLLLYLWSRVLRRGKTLKKNAWAFSIGYGLSTLLILLSLFVSQDLIPYLIGLGLLFEMTGPLFGFYISNNKIPVHSDHIIERHGLFTIILLGEGIVAVAINFTSVMTGINWYVLGFAFILILCLWWLYFDCGYGFSANLSNSIRKVFEFGYGQFFVYLTIAIVGISLEYALHDLEAGHHPAGFLPGRVMAFAAGFFLLAMSTVQLLISHEKPKKIYLPRFFVGLLLCLGSVFLHFDQNLTYIVMATAVLTLLTINDVRQWARYNRMTKI